MRQYTMKSLWEMGICIIHNLLLIWKGLCNEFKWNQRRGTPMYLETLVIRKYALRNYVKTFVHHNKTCSSI